MRISEAIKALQKIKKSLGDLEVATLTEVDGRFCIEYGKVFLAVLPDGEEESICALMGEIEDDENRPPLRVV